MCIRDSINNLTNGDSVYLSSLYGYIHDVHGVVNVQELLDVYKRQAYETMADTTQESVKRGLNTFKNLGIGIFQSSEGIVSDLTGLFAQSGLSLIHI